MKTKLLKLIPLLGLLFAGNAHAQNVTWVFNNSNLHPASPAWSVIIPTSSTTINYLRIAPTGAAGCLQADSVGVVTIQGSTCGSGGGSQTPWTSNISANGYKLNNILSVNATGTLTFTADNGSPINFVLDPANSQATLDTTFVIGGDVIGGGADNIRTFLNARVSQGFFASGTSMFSGLINTASSTLLNISNLSATNAMTTNSTSTSKYISGSLSVNGASSTVNNLNSNLASIGTTAQHMNVGDVTGAGYGPGDITFTGGASLRPGADTWAFRSGFLPLPNAGIFFSGTQHAIQFVDTGGATTTNFDVNVGVQSWIRDGWVIATTTPYVSPTGTTTKLTVQGSVFIGGDLLGVQNLVATGTLFLSQLTGTQCLHEVGGIVSGTGSDCGGSLTPWTSNINAAGFALTSAGGIFSSGTSMFAGGLITNGSSTILGVANFTGTNGTTTNATTTSEYLSGNAIWNTSSSTILNLNILNASSTNATSTSLYVSGSLGVNGASSTILNLVTINSTSTSATTTSFYTKGSAMFNNSSTSIVGTFNVSATATSTWQRAGLQSVDLATRHIFASTTGLNLLINTVNSSSAPGAGAINVVAGSGVAAGAGGGGAILLQAGSGAAAALSPGSGSNGGTLKLQGGSGGVGSDDDGGGNPGGQGGSGTTITLTAGTGGTGGAFNGTAAGQGGNGGNIVIQNSSGGAPGSGGTAVVGLDGSFLVRAGTYGNASATGIFAIQSGASGNQVLFSIATTSAATSTGITIFHGGAATNTLVGNAVNSISFATNTGATAIMSIDTNVRGRLRLGGTLGFREDPINVSTTNSYAGQAQLGGLASGQAVVNTSYTIDGNTRFILTDIGGSNLVNIGSVYISATTSSSFTIKSTNGNDGSNIYWIVLQDTPN